MLLQARWSRFADGADEIHKWRVAEAVIAAYNEDGTTRAATGDLPL
jgi:acyl-CoA dehydrogenase